MRKYCSECTWRHGCECLKSMPFDPEKDTEIHADSGWLEHEGPEIGPKVFPELYEEAVKACKEFRIFYCYDEWHINDELFSELQERYNHIGEPFTPEIAKWVNG